MSNWKQQLDNYITGGGSPGYDAAWEDFAEKTLNNLTDECYLWIEAHEEIQHRWLSKLYDRLECQDVEEPSGEWKLFGDINPEKAARIIERAYRRYNPIGKYAVWRNTDYPYFHCAEILETGTREGRYTCSGWGYGPGYEIKPEWFVSADKGKQLQKLRLTLEEDLRNLILKTKKAGWLQVIEMLGADPKKPYQSKQQ